MFQCETVKGYLWYIWNKIKCLNSRFIKKISLHSVENTNVIKTIGTKAHLAGIKWSPISK